MAVRIFANWVAVAGAGLWLCLSLWFLSIVSRDGWPLPLPFGILLMLSPALAFLVHVGLLSPRRLRESYIGLSLAVVSLFTATAYVVVVYSTNFHGYK